MTIILCIASGCSGIQDKKDSAQYNFRFTGYNAVIDNPDNDRRCFYRLLIDKIRSERTTTGLESQKKIFKGNLEYGKHLLSIEKWVLDERKKIYIKLNNIDQPGPNYIYFEIIKGKFCEVEMTTSGRKKTGFVINQVD